MGYASTNDTSNWRFWRNKANTLVKKGKTTYYRSLIEANIKDSKMLWNIIRDLAPKAKSALPVSLRDGDTVLSDTQDICDSFNKFFANIAAELQVTCQPTEMDVTQCYKILYLPGLHQINNLPPHQ